MRSPEDAQAALALRRTLIDLLRAEAAHLELPPGAGAADVLAALDRLEAPAASEGALGYDQAIPQIQVLAGLLFAHRGPKDDLLAVLRAHRLVLPVPGGAVLVDFRLFRDLHTIASGAWEPQNLGFMRRCLRPGMTVLDVGAHVGHFSILAAEMVAGGEGRVLAFEPAPSNLARLQQNLTLSQPRAPVEVVPCAVGSQPGTARFFDDGGTGGTEFSMYAERHGGAGVAFTATIDTIDGVCRSRGIERVGFIKIDVEGAELEVLAGAAAILDASRELSLLIELHPWVVPPDKVIAAVAGKGFRLFDVKAPETPLSPETAVKLFATGGDLAAIR